VTEKSRDIAGKVALIGECWNGRMRERQCRNCGNVLPPVAVQWCPRCGRENPYPVRKGTILLTVLILGALFLALLWSRTGQ
jgi:hypothetical protein